MSESIKQAERRGYDGTVARIAGNLLSGTAGDVGMTPAQEEQAARWAVRLARAIVAETIRTEPKGTGPDGSQGFWRGRPIAEMTDDELTAKHVEQLAEIEREAAK